MIAITGATGFLGAALAREFLASGERVRAIARKRSPMAALRGLDVELATAELDDERSLARAFEGARAVCHAAGHVSICRGEWPELYRSNVEGTKAVLGAARAAGAERLVYLSSIEALDMAASRGPITEAAGLVGEDGSMEYGRSKSLATQAVLSASTAGFETLVAYPTAVMGPLDFRPSSLGSMVRDFAEGALPAFIAGGFDFVDTRDVARGTALALRAGRPGEGYILGGRYAEIGETHGHTRTPLGQEGPAAQAAALDGEGGRALGRALLSGDAEAGPIYSILRGSAREPLRGRLLEGEEGVRLLRPSPRRDPGRHPRLVRGAEDPMSGALLGWRRRPSAFVRGDGDIGRAADDSDRPA